MEDLIMKQAAAKFMLRQLTEEQKASV